MSPLSVIAYTVAFVVISVQFTGYNENFSIPDNIWTVFSVLSGLLLAGSMIIDKIRNKADKPEKQKQ